MGEGRVGVIDDQLDALFEWHPEGEGVVLGVERVDDAGGSHLSQFPFRLAVDERHDRPPA